MAFVDIITMMSAKEDGTFLTKQECKDLISREVESHMAAVNLHTFDEIEEEIYNFNDIMNRMLDGSCRLAAEKITDDEESHKWIISKEPLLNEYREFLDSIFEQILKTSGYYPQDAFNDVLYYNFIGGHLKNKLLSLRNRTSITLDDFPYTSVGLNENQFRNYIIQSLGVTKSDGKGAVSMLKSVNNFVRTCRKIKELHADYVERVVVKYADYQHVEDAGLAWIYFTRRLVHGIVKENELPNKCMEQFNNLFLGMRNSFLERMLDITIPNAALIINEFEDATPESIYSGTNNNSEPETPRQCEHSKKSRMGKKKTVITDYLTAEDKESAICAIGKVLEGKKGCNAYELIYSLKVAGIFSSIPSAPSVMEAFGNLGAESGYRRFFNTNPKPSKERADFVKGEFNKYYIKQINDKKQG